MDFVLNTTKKIDIEKVIQIAKRAGAKVMEVYRLENFEGITDFKSDASPLTLADKESNKIIVNELSQLYPDIPFISEEEKEVPYAQRRSWTYYWMIDPLDGTKEFINRNGEFTVNIALMKNQYPVVGIVYAPVLDSMYIGAEGIGAFREINGNREVVKVRGVKEKLVAVGSRSHATEEDIVELQKYDIVSHKTIGSSLKFCLLATGEADVYFRSGPTMEWDTAAGQAVLEAAGGYMTDKHNKRFEYNKERLLNGSFLCLGFKQ